MRGAPAVFMVLMVSVAAACSSDASEAACTTARPERIVASPLEVKDLSRTIPLPSIDMDGDGSPDEVHVDHGVVTVNGLVLTTTAAGGVSIRVWADVDGDGADDLLVDDGKLWLVLGGTWRGRHDVRTVGRSIPDELTTIWTADLDGRRGADFYSIVQRGTHTTTLVYDVLHRPVRVTRRLRGSPRNVVRLERGGPLESVLLDAGPPTSVTFAPRPRSVLRADLGESHRVTWVRVFDEGEARKIALQVDRRVAVWPVPALCG